MRILLSKKSKKDLFDFLLKKYKVNTLNELSMHLNKPPKTINNWRYNYKKYLPDFLIKEYDSKLDITDIQEDNWGMVKGGKGGIKKKREHLKKLWSNPDYRLLRKKIGKKAIINLLNHKAEFNNKALQTKLKKREYQSNKLELINNSYFINKTILLNNSEVKFSRKDRLKEIKLPKSITTELAEEIGIHLGDGCMSFNRNYFSVKTNKKEEEYVTNFLIPLYKKIYNLDIKLMQLKSVSGFEIYSRALCEFKNKSIGLPYGEKVNNIKIPNVILESKDKDIYRAIIRGLFDTDGCIHITRKNDKEYPVISVTIKSEELIKQVTEMLKLLGFLPYSNNKSYISLSGIVMLKKWTKEINSNNPVKLIKLSRASSSTRTE